MTLAMCWYAISARKWFKGPKINVEHMIHRDGSGNGSRNEEMDNAVVEKDGQTVGEDGSDETREEKELNE